MKRTLSIVFLLSLTLSLPVAAQESVWIPLAAHTEGVGGSAWRTDLGLLNACFSGFHRKEKDTDVITPSVPSLPINRFFRSGPVDDLGVRRVFRILPSGSTASSPKSISSIFP